MLHLETDVDKERRALLHQRLRDDNTAASPHMRALRDPELEAEVPLHVWALDAEGELVGGLAARTWARWLHLELLWVDTAHRGSGLGARLLAEAERLAREDRSCARSRVETWDFQAPGFYRKQGYEIRGQVEDFPPGVTQFTLTKNLV
ncbi:GNAT family N-acetyltransferase [Streptomyces sp. NBC_00525]|uniref:GNAT family N-acetyltransferase n=1 Tax=Streptomyces sp. NBC_00525 TaxID=2903660 RepID=UPI002E810CDC|nr:GNAT family N-acetyltransferase [Streptomyces sp. NBC_00525]WUC94088.1 GNAT family N-acetyltransferase [Streptomyces sp. NBC_00525]